MTQRSNGPACGNNPNHPLTEGDRRAVAEFRTYLADRAALRDRIAEELAARFAGGQTTHGMRVVFEGPRGTKPAVRMATPLEAADAVLAVLPADTDRAAEEESLGEQLDAAGQTIAELTVQNRKLEEELRRMATAPAPTDRAAVLREAADALDNSETLRDHTDDHMDDVYAATAELRRMADETPAAGVRPDEDPARIDRLRPEFTAHASVEAIDAQLQRTRRQQALWERRMQRLTSLRETRVAQKERGEWPAAGARQDGAQEPESPAYTRLKAAAAKASTEAAAHALRGMGRTFRLARQYSTRPIPAAEVLKALGLDENANIIEEPQP